MGKFIKIDEAIQEDWLWQDAERLRWWLDLLFMANDEDKLERHHGHFITVKRGCVVTSSKILCERWKRSKPTIFAFLKELEAINRITSELLYHRIYVLTICEYDSWTGKGSGKVDRLFDRSLYRSPAHSLYHLQEGITNAESEPYAPEQSQPLYHSSYGANFQGGVIINNSIDNRLYSNIQDNNTINAGARAREDTDYFSQVEKSEMFWQQAAMSLHAQVEDLKKMLPVFDAEHKAKETLFRNFADYRNRFFNWMRIAISINQEKQQRRNETIQRDRYADRRGVDSTATSAQDYTDSF